MDERPITCQYVFTETEYRKSIDCLFRGQATAIQLFGLVITLIFIALINWGLYLEYKDGQLSDNHGIKWGDVSSAELPFGSGLVIQLLLVCTPLYAYIFQFYFRRSANRNKQVVIKIDETKIDERTNNVDSSYQWHELSGAKECKAGFVLLVRRRHYWKQLFYWLPMHGFASSEAIDQCRTLIQSHTKDFKRVAF